MSNGVLERNRPFGNFCWRCLDKKVEVVTFSEDKLANESFVCCSILIRCHQCSSE